MRITRARTRLAIAVLLLSAYRTSAQTGAPPRVELIHIDGSKNPELIPEWSAWGYAFRVLAGGPRQLPTTLIHHVSKEEEAFVMAHADRVQRLDADCQQRLSRIIARQGVEKLDALDVKVRDLALECRRATLDARDQVLAGLNPEAQLALSAFVESMKAGTSVTVPKARLARFREPE